MVLIFGLEKPKYYRIMELQRRTIMKERKVKGEIESAQKDEKTKDQAS